MYGLYSAVASLYLLVYALLFVHYALQQPRAWAGEGISLFMTASSDTMAKNQENGSDNTNREETQKSYQDILRQQVHEELVQINRPTAGLFISGLSAGLDIGFSLLLMAVMYTMTNGVFSEPVVNILVANMYSIGFIFVILGRSELFTEHTTLAFLPVLNGRASLKALSRLWATIYTSNLIGAAIFALLATIIGPALDVIEPAAFHALARPLVAHPWWIILLSGVLAGWMMGLLSWLVTASRDTVSQVLIVWLVTTGSGLAHLHHSIVGTVEVLAAVFAGQGVTLAEFGHFLLWATLGNAIGGLVFVALIKYGHASRQSQEGAPV
jgi:formate/nitrite transporter FocA (FNT family)